MSVGDALQVLVIWVLCHPAVDECTREIIHGILLILDSLSDNLRIKMVAQAVVQMALYRERLVQKLFKEILLLQHTLGICVLSRSEYLHDYKATSQLMSAHLLALPTICRMSVTG